MTSTALPRVPRKSRRRRVSPRSRHTLMVGVLKILLPATAIGLVLLLIVWSQLDLDDNRIRIGFADLAPDDIESVNVVNARYEGVDEKNRPFTVTAAHAKQVDESAEVLDLVSPRADMTTEGGAWVSVTSDTGVYARQADLLDLKGSVSLFHDRGYEFHAQTVRVNLKASTAVSYEPVDGQGPNGHLTAQGLEITHSGDRILFTGRSKLVIYPQPDGELAAPTGTLTE